MYMMSAELQLSINSLLVLNPFIVNVMTSGSSCGCLTPLASHSEKNKVILTGTTVLHRMVFNVDAIDLSIVCPF